MTSVGGRTQRPKTGEKMKRIVTHLALAAATAILATGCVPVRHNLPPEQRMMQPGPGVGGPGPGVLGPQAYGMMGANAPAAAANTEGMITEGAIDASSAKCLRASSRQDRTTPKFSKSVSVNSPVAIADAAAAAVAADVSVADLTFLLAVAWQ